MESICEFFRNCDFVLFVQGYYDTIHLILSSTFKKKDCLGSTVKMWLESICEFFRNCDFVLFVQGYCVTIHLILLSRYKKKDCLGSTVKMWKKNNLSHSGNFFTRINRYEDDLSCCNLTAFTGIKCKQNVLQFMRNCPMNKLYKS
jgi:hypothetical protein